MIFSDIMKLVLVIFFMISVGFIGDGVKKIEIENTADEGGAFATMAGYLVDT